MNQRDNRFSLDNMLKTTAQQLGTTPEALKMAAQNGNLNSLLNNQPQSEQMKKILSDPNEAQKLLNNPAVKKLIEQLNKDNQ